MGYNTPWIQPDLEQIKKLIMLICDVHPSEYLASFDNEAENAVNELLAPYR